MLAIDAPAEPRLGPPHRATALTWSADFDRERVREALAMAQLLRIKQAGLNLTVCVEQVAASGGYMMACVADRIVGTVT